MLTKKRIIFGKYFNKYSFVFKLLIERKKKKKKIMKKKYLFVTVEISLVGEFYVIQFETSRETFVLYKIALIKIRNVVPFDKGSLWITVVFRKRTCTY